jgi:hypothetical protein
MFHDKITTHFGGKAGPAGIRRAALAPDAISRVSAGRPARARPLHHAAPDEVPRIVRRWLRRHPQTPDELPADAVQASAGRSNDFRPCSDARAVRQICMLTMVIVQSSATAPNGGSGAVTTRARITESDSGGLVGGR